MAEKLGVIPVRDRTNDLVALYGNYQKQIISDLLELGAGDYTEIKAIQVQNRIRKKIDVLTKKAMKWSMVSVDQAYKVAADRTTAALNLLGSKKNRNFDQNKHKMAKSEYSKTITQDLATANYSIMDTVNAYIYYARTSSAALSAEFQAMQEYGFGPGDEILIDAIIAETIANELSVNEATKRINNLLLSRIIDGNLIAVKNRHYNLKYYSRMVARTRLRQAQTDAVRNYCQEYDNDLVQFSTHDNPCPVCAPLEGQVFSVTGRSKDYPVLSDDVSPPIHPNCEHNLNPTSERAIRIRAEFE